MITIEAKIKRKINPFHIQQWWIDMTVFLFLIAFLLIVSHGVLMGLLYSLSDLTPYLFIFAPYFFILMILYGPALLIFYMVTDIFGNKLQRMTKRRELMRATLPKEVEVHTSIPPKANGMKGHSVPRTSIPPKGVMIPCRYLDMFVLDGREWNTRAHVVNELKVDNEKLKKVYNKTVNTCSSMLHILFSFYISSNINAVLMISTKILLLPVTYTVFRITNKLMRNMRFTKLLVRLFCYLNEKLKNINNRALSTSMLCISFLIYVSYNIYVVFMISTKTILLPVTYTVFIISNELIKKMRFTKLLILLFCYLTVPNIETPKSTRGRSKKNGLELYLLDGDVESNPGPVNNNIVTPKGRGRPPKKSSGFKGKKLNFNQLDTVQPIIVRNDNFRNKIDIMKSDIRIVNCDAIVNAAKVTLLGGGGIDVIIHTKAGPVLKQKCRDLPVKEKLNGDDVRCYPGECEVTDTKGTNLTNCKYVFHTVGPDCRKESDMSVFASTLRSCYENCLQNVLTYNIKSIAFCCISTGIFEYDNKEAAIVALESVQSWLEKNYQSVEKIIFCTHYV